MTWTRLNRQIVVDSKWLRVFRDAYRLPSGSELSDYYVIERSDFVVVVAGDGNSVILVHQYRPATHKFYWSLPAGYVSADETPELAAIRELKEETGVAADSAQLLAVLDPLPGYLRSSASVVCCSSSIQNLRVEDTDEVAEARAFEWPRILDMMRTGEIDEMQAVAALLMARQFGDEANALR